MKIHDGWRSDEVFGMQEGDIYSIEGIYERRTFWQWLTRQPRRLKLFIVTEVK